MNSFLIANRCECNLCTAQNNNNCNQVYVLCFELVDYFLVNAGRMAYLSVNHRLHTNGLDHLFKRLMPVNQSPHGQVSRYNRTVYGGNVDIKYSDQTHLAVLNNY